MPDPEKCPECHHRRGPARDDYHDLELCWGDDDTDSQIRCLERKASRLQSENARMREAARPFVRAWKEGSRRGINVTYDEWSKLAEVFR